MDYAINQLLPSHFKMRTIAYSLIKKLSNELFILDFIFIFKSTIWRRVKVHGFIFRRGVGYNRMGILRTGYRVLETDTFFSIPVSVYPEPDFLRGDPVPG